VKSIPGPTVSETRAAQVADVLARAVRNEEIVVSDALRIIRTSFEGVTPTRSFRSRCDLVELRE
jgi:hypothetical protein